MEKVVVFNIKSALGSFQRPQSNNNPSTFHVIPKSALVGMISAVIGLDREFMKENDMYRLLTEKLQYSIKLRKPFQIKTWSEYGYNHGNVFQSNRPIYTPSKYERLEDVEYDVYVLYDDSDQDVSLLLRNFVDNIKNGVSAFPVYMGMANFPADISYVGEYDALPRNGRFNTASFCTNLVSDMSQPFERIRTDEIPTQSMSYLAHDINSYKRIYFHENGGEIMAHGNYHEVNQEAVEFI